MLSHRSTLNFISLAKFFPYAILLARFYVAEFWCNPQCVFTKLEINALGNTWKEHYCPAESITETATEYTDTRKKTQQLREGTLLRIVYKSE